MYNIYVYIYAEPADKHTHIIRGGVMQKHANIYILLLC